MKREGIGSYKYGRRAERREGGRWRAGEEGIGGGSSRWILEPSRGTRFGLDWIGRQGRDGEADASQSAWRYPQHPPSVRDPALFVSLVGSAGRRFAEDSFNRSQPATTAHRSIVVLDALGSAADLRPRFYLQKKVLFIFGLNLHFDPKLKNEVH